MLSLKYNSRNIHRIKVFLHILVKNHVSSFSNPVQSEMFGLEMCFVVQYQYAELTV